jgi:hypothetical protein
MAKYRITSLLSAIDSSLCPHPVVGILFPGADVVSCSVSPSEIIVELATPQTPADLGPLVRVELISTP